MNTSSLRAFCLSVCCVQAGAMAALRPEAPPFEPSLWLNTAPGFAPKDLDGRLVLLEVWATW